MNRCISVIIPVYNGEKTLEECVCSIKNQKYKNVEIIISDDGSADGSMTLAKKLAEKYNNITVIENEHGGVSMARNAGIERANGEYIAFIDCDDTIKPQMLDAMCLYMEQYSADLAVVGIERVDRFGKITFEPYSEQRVICIENPAKLYEKSMYFNSCSNKLYRSDIIKNNNVRFDKNIYIGEDFLFNTQYMRYIDKTVVISEPMYTYIMSGTTLSPFTDTRRFDSIAKMYDTIIPFAENDAELKACIKRKIYDEYLFAIRLYCISGEKFSQKVRMVSKVFKCKQYNAVCGTIKVRGVYGIIIGMKNPWLVGLYFVLSMIKNKQF